MVVGLQRREFAKNLNFFFKKSYFYILYFYIFYIKNKFF
jgi:hypothetical protein